MAKTHLGALITSWNAPDPVPYRVKKFRCYLIGTCLVIIEENTEIAEIIKVKVDNKLFLCLLYNSKMSIWIWQVTATIIGAFVKVSSLAMSCLHKISHSVQAAPASWSYSCTWMSALLFAELLGNRNIGSQDCCCGLGWMGGHGLMERGEWHRDRGPWWTMYWSSGQSAG